MIRVSLKALERHSALAERGTIFLNAHGQSPLCDPVIS